MSDRKPRLLLSAAQGDLENFHNAFTACGAHCSGGYCPELSGEYDGLVICGGSDVDTALYGQERKDACEPDINRDRHELMLIDAFMKAGKPIFGICRGIQILNVAFGGTLIQDLGQHLNSFHRGTGEHHLYHPIRTTEGSILHKLYGPIVHVNSLHHQAVDKVAPGFHATAWAESGFVEAMEHDSAPVFAVQFHPERQTCAFLSPDSVDGAPLISYFIQLCKAHSPGSLN